MMKTSSLPDIYFLFLTEEQSSYLFSTAKTNEEKVVDVFKVVNGTQYYYGHRTDVPKLLEHPIYVIKEGMLPSVCALYHLTGSLHGIDTFIEQYT